MRKYIKYLFIFVTLFVLICINIPNVNADSTSGIASQEGASIRTSGNAGIRFTASVESLPEGSTHGFYLALGTHTFDEMSSAIESKESLVGENKLVNKVVEGEDTRFSIVIYGLSKEDYASNITVIPYVLLSDNATYEYGTVQTRNAADVARNVYNTSSAYNNDDNLVYTIAKACAVKVTDESGNVSYYKNYVYNKDTEDYFKVTSETASNTTISLIRGTYTNKMYVYPGMKVYGANKDVEIISGGDNPVRDSDSNIVGETVLTQPIYITGSTVEINGISFTGESAMIIRGSYGTITFAYNNCYYTGNYGIYEAKMGESGTEPADQTHSNLTINNNYFLSTNSSYSVDLYLISTINNITIQNNNFESQLNYLSYVETEDEVPVKEYNDYAIKIAMPKASSTTTIRDNKFNHLGAYYVIAIGEGLSSQTAYTVSIENNQMTPSPTTSLCGNGICVLETKKDGVVSIIHNTNFVTSQYFNAVVVSGAKIASNSTTVTTTVNLLYNHFYLIKGENPGFRTDSDNAYTRIAICCKGTVSISGNYYSESTSTYCFTKMDANSNVQGSYHKNVADALPLKNENASTVNDANLAYQEYLNN